MATWRHIGKWLVGLVGIFLAACQPSQVEQPLQYSAAPAHGAAVIYRFAVHPLYNPELLASAYQPLVDHLNTRLSDAGLDARLELEASRDYAAFEAKYAAREPAFLLPNPWQTLQAIRSGYQVIAMAGDAEDFHGIFIVRRDAKIREPADLKGKAVSYPAATALAAALMPQYFLHQHGVNVMRDIQNLYVGSQESSIMNVYLGQSAAGATWPPPWRLFQKNHPKEAAELQVLWRTEALINNSVMVRDDVPAQVRNQVLNSLLALTQTSAGQTILANMSTKAFYPASNATFDMVKGFIARFERDVRPVESH